MNRKSHDNARVASHTHSSGNRARAGPRHTARGPGVAGLRAITDKADDRTSKHVHAALRTMAGDLHCADTFAAAAALCAMLEALREILAVRSRAITARLDALLGQVHRLAG
jgi:hypothetical protein